jgi:hypothetical protein
MAAVSQLALVHVWSRALHFFFVFFAEQLRFVSAVSA